MRKIKLLAAVVIASATLALGTTGINVSAATQSSEVAQTGTASKINGFSIVNGTLIGYSGAGGNVTIPSEVTRISSSVFRGNNTITSVVIPSSVKVIEENAFRECTKLKTITIDSGVTEIWDNAFRGCTSLTSVTIPKSVRLIIAHLEIVRS